MNHPHPDLPYPAKLAPKTLRIVALGGLGEIGRNMTVFEYDGKLLVVDCGVLFPEEKINLESISFFLIFPISVSA